MLFGKKKATAPQTQIEKMQQQGRQIVPLVLTCRHVPDTLADQMKHMLAGGAIIVLYPRADSYSVNGFPLAYGSALQIWLSDTLGQICMRTLYSPDAVTVVQESEPFAAADWYDVFREWDRLFTELAMMYPNHYALEPKPTVKQGG